MSLLPRRSASPFATLRLETLENREVPAVLNVVPTTSTADATNKYLLAEAVQAAAPGDTIIIRPGTTPDAANVLVAKNNLTIVGDSSVPGFALARYGIYITSSGVSLSNLNLGDVTVASPGSGATVTRSSLVHFFEEASTTGVGNNVISQNSILGGVYLRGNSTAGATAGDVIDRNSFSSGEGYLLFVRDSANTQITNNTFTSGANGNKVAIGLFGNSSNVLIANNSISTAGDFGIYLDNGISAGTNFVLSTRIQNNTISVASSGFAAYSIRSVGGSLTALYQGNDFAGSGLGVVFNRGTGAPDSGIIDLGGGTTTLGTSLGGNNFRGRTAALNNTAISAIAGTAGTYQAQFNNFELGQVVGGVIFDGNDNSGASAFVNPANALTANRSTVQSYYTKILGRTGTLAELDAWVATLPTQGLAGVSRSILYSAESINRTVGELYIRYLNRPSTVAERAGWVSAITNGNTLEQVQAAFLGSVEFQQKTFGDKVQSLYLNTLGRTANTAEVSAWNAQLNTIGANGVALAILRSAEYLGQAVVAEYRDLLHRLPSVAEISAWLNSGKDLLSIKQAILSSSEFYNRG